MNENINNSDAKTGDGISTEVYRTTTTTTKASKNNQTQT